MVTYTVVSGDTMSRIATKYGIQLSDLLAANPQITNSSLIFPGQRINIPNTDKSTYIVMSGDTMWSIARKYGIGLSNLIALNPQIINSSVISPGQKINVPSTSVPNNLRALETEAIRLVNIERAKAGKSELTPNNQISNVARIKSQDFINNNYFSHNSPIYGSPFNMLSSFGIPFNAAGENIASGQKTATEVINTWMNSPGHKANILNSIYNQVGVGVASDNKGKLFWTLILIRS
jgi:uncharacterized YkwD family protein/spore coat assembly protein SafA